MEKWHELPWLTQPVPLPMVNGDIIIRMESGAEIRFPVVKNRDWRAARPGS